MSGSLLLEVRVWPPPARARTGRGSRWRVEVRPHGGRVEVGCVEKGHIEVVGREEIQRAELQRAEVGRAEVGRIEVGRAELWPRIQPRQGRTVGSTTRRTVHWGRTC